jgi:hypothetical protein
LDGLPWHTGQPGSVPRVKSKGRRATCADGSKDKTACLEKHRVELTLAIGLSPWMQGTSIDRISEDGQAHPQRPEGSRRPGCAGCGDAGRHRSDVKLGPTQRTPHVCPLRLKWGCGGPDPGAKKTAMSGMTDECGTFHSVHGCIELAQTAPADCSGQP